GAGSGRAMRDNSIGASPPPTRGGRNADRHQPRGISGGGACRRPTRNCSRSSLTISASPRWGRRLATRLERLGADFTGSNARGALKIEDEDLAVANLSGPCRADDDLRDFLGLVIIDRDLELQLRNVIDGIFRTAIDLLMSSLTAIAADFTDRKARDAG